MHWFVHCSWGVDDGSNTVWLLILISNWHIVWTISWRTLCLEKKSMDIAAKYWIDIYSVWNPRCVRNVTRVVRSLLLRTDVEVSGDQPNLLWLNLNISTWCRVGLLPSVQWARRSHEKDDLIHNLRRMDLRDDDNILMKRFESVTSNRWSFMVYRTWVDQDDI